MDFVQRLETLEQRLAFTRAEVLAAQTESREQLRQRIETTQSEIAVGDRVAATRRRGSPLLRAMR
ncbi:hypothetical protein ACIBTZ_22835 [Micromonospora sp. NPDC049460]|uniref:hypothetical protein n=1 Tax=Micromonospora sp. NPDC049460 TaxID=3364272 RepID=UPI0037A70E9B